MSAPGSDLRRRAVGHILACFLLTTLIASLAPVSASGKQLTEEQRQRVEAAYLRADSLAELFEYPAAARVLEELLVEDLSVETKIEINTRLASVYEQNLSEEQAINCLLDNLRSRPEYQIPSSLQSQLQRLYDRAYEIYRDELAVRNHPPYFTKIPVTESVAAGRELRFSVRAADDDGDDLKLSIGGESGASIEDKGKGAGVVRFSPPIASVGQDRTIWVVVDDGIVADSARVVIDVGAVGSQRASYAYRSLLVPGWGQYSDGRSGTGTVFLIGGLLAAGASVVTTLGYNSAVNDYNDALDRLNSAATSAELSAIWNELNDKHETASDARGRRNITYIATGAIWAINVIEAFLNQPAAPDAATATGQRTPGTEHRFAIALDHNRVFLRVSF